MTARSRFTEFDNAHWSIVPPHLREGLKAYIESGQCVGGFLEALLSNDLTQAVLRADPSSFAALPQLVRFLWNYCPPDSFGSASRVAEWMAIGGLGAAEDDEPTSGAMSA